MPGNVGVTPARTRMNVVMKQCAPIAASQLARLFSRRRPVPSGIPQGLGPIHAQPSPRHLRPASTGGVPTHSAAASVPGITGSPPASPASGRRNSPGYVVGAIEPHAYATRELTPWHVPDPDETPTMKANLPCHVSWPAHPGTEDAHHPLSEGSKDRGRGLWHLCMDVIERKSELRVAPSSLPAMKVGTHCRSGANTPSIWQVGQSVGVGRPCRH